MRATLLLILLQATVVSAAAGPKQVGAVSLDRSSRFLFPSEQVGDTFRIDVVLPIGYEESDATYPVVLVTDSNYLLASAAATDLAQATGHLPKMILVGIGYDVPSIADTAQIRARDLTPTCDPGYVAKDPNAKGLCGKADRFIAFIREELKPFIAKRYRATTDTTLVGFSFGGLFALHTLLTGNDIADRYVIGSASIEWDEETLFAEERKYAERHADLKKVVYLAAAGLEGNATIPNTYLMYERLVARNYPGLVIQVEILRDETHMTAVNATVMRGLRAVFAE